MSEDKEVQVGSTLNGFMNRLEEQTSRLRTVNNKLRSYDDELFGVLTKESSDEDEKDEKERTPDGVFGELEKAVSKVEEETSELIENVSSVMRQL